MSAAGRAAVKPPRMGSRRSLTGMLHTLNAENMFKLGIAAMDKVIPN
jgi:hypothetical protein